MKKIITSCAFALLCVGTAMAQVAIGGDKGNTDNNSILLEFDDSVDNVKGIIIPAVENTNKALATNTANNHGTFLFDKSDNTVKVYANQEWKLLTEEGTGDGTDLLKSNNAEIVDVVGVVIGNDTTDTKGVVVLNHDTKAMVLPKITDPHLNVKNPYPGMMCYDIGRKSLAVFNGSYWYYWK